MSTNSTCSVVLSPVASITVATLNALSCLLSVGGNTVVLVAIFRSPLLWTTSYVFVASLALADLIVGAVVNPLYVSLSLMESLRDVQQIKNAETFAWLLTVTATTYNLCAMSIERFIAVTSPLRYYQRVTMPRCLVVIAFTWVFATVFASASFFIPLENIAGLWIAGSILTVPIPLVIIAFCYCKMWKVARLHANKINAITISSTGNGEVQEETRIRAKHKKAACTFGIITALFGVLFAPSVVTNFIAMSARTQCEFFEVNRVWFWTSVISYSSSSVNPWIYAIRMTDFRVACKKIFTCQQ